jgi:hypothetical protein
MKAQQKEGKIMQTFQIERVAVYRRGWEIGHIWKHTQSNAHSIE